MASRDAAAGRTTVRRIAEDQPDDARQRAQLQGQAP
jgi:hypothetical protein